MRTTRLRITMRDFEPAVVRVIDVPLLSLSGSLFADLDRSVPADQPMEAIVPVLLEVAERNGVSFVGA